MCGIAGAFSFRPEAEPVNIAVVERINQAQRRRGPDGEGHWESSNSRIALAHRRLAIIDTGQSGAQPMTDATGRWTITFNGEIYNYRELRVDLERAGVKFLTQCDTEVLINAIAVWGESGLLKVRGMFAFALWDAQEQELWLARDPYGIKPLYTAQSRGVLWFASQARALARHAPVDISRDPAGLVGFFLSAGIDSSTIAALASEQRSDLQTITLAFEEYHGSSQDEAPLAEATAKLLGTRHSTIRIRRDQFLAMYDDFFESMDQPSIDGLNSYLISHAAATLGLKVALSGLGGDELFGGYSSFRQISKLLKIGRSIPISTEAICRIEGVIRALAPRSVSPKLSNLLSHSQDLPSAYLLRRCLHTSDELELLLDLSWIKAGLGRLQTTQALQNTIDALSKGNCGVHAQVAALESCWYMRNQLLRDVDWAGMAHSLEVRVPLVDCRLLERLGPAIPPSNPPTKADLLTSAQNMD